jgi:molybdate transport system regulatory protein
MHGIAIGPGKAQLLEIISITGSISEAAKTMEMSYRTAWQLVTSMNEHFREPLIQTVKGGKAGGGASLTELGWQVLQIYKAMQERALAAISDDMARLELLLRR